MKLLLFVIVSGLAVLLALILIRTIVFPSSQLPSDPPIEAALDRDEMSRRLSRALQFKTISFQDSKIFHREEFLNLYRYLEHSFPLVHASLTKEVIGDLSLLYTWAGSEPEENPILLYAHTDIVPIEAAKETRWTHPPFEGHIAGSYIWGRGSLDMKVGVLGLLEAVETLLQKDFQPSHTIYLAFGHDEETGGGEGAARIAELLDSRDVELEYVLDEGLAITHGILPGVTRPVALVGIAEKGYVSLELAVETEGGHSSMPPKQTAISILSTALHNLESNPFRSRITRPVQQMFEHLAPQMPFIKRMILANLWCFDGLLERQLAASPGTNALIQTTMAATIFSSGVKENVLPKTARAVVNFRILPENSIGRVVQHTRRTIADSTVKIRILEYTGIEPSATSNIESSNFKIFQRTIHQVFPDVLVAPSLFIGSTDSKHFAGLTPNIFRFLPIRFERKDLKRIHGRDERISVHNYEEIIRFYIQLIYNSSSLTRPGPS